MTKGHRYAPFLRGRKGWSAFFFYSTASGFQEPNALPLRMIAHEHRRNHDVEWNLDPGKAWASGTPCGTACHPGRSGPAGAVPGAGRWRTGGTLAAANACTHWRSGRARRRSAWGEACGSGVAGPGGAVPEGTPSPGRSWSKRITDVCMASAIALPDPPPTPRTSPRKSS